MDQALSVFGHMDAQSFSCLMPRSLLGSDGQEDAGGFNITKEPVSQYHQVNKLGGISPQRQRTDMAVFYINFAMYRSILLGWSKAFLMCYCSLYKV